MKKEENPYKLAWYFILGLIVGEILAVYTMFIAG